MDKIIDKTFFRKEEELNNLKDVFKRLVALDIYFDIKNNQNRGKEAKIEKIGTKSSNSSVNDTTINNKNSDLGEYYENSSATDNTPSIVPDTDNSIFSNDQAFSELNSNRTNLDNYSEQVEEVEDLRNSECFVQHIINDLVSLIKVKRLYYHFFEDPLVQYISKQYKTHSEDLYALYKKYFNYFNEHIQLERGEIYHYLRNNLLCNLNYDFGQISIVKVLKNEINELARELNGLIISYYDSRINLNEIYYLIEYYNLDIESLSIDTNTVQYGLRMDRSVIEYFSNEDFVSKLLNQLSNNAENEPKLNYRQFYNLVVHTANIFNKNKSDSNNVKGSNDHGIYESERKKIINNLLFKNVYGIDVI